MISSNPNEVFHLSAVEVETLRRSALERNLTFDPQRTEYMACELSDYGLVREAYNSTELAARGISSKNVVTSFDALADEAAATLLVDAPFAKIRKWQIPVDICEWRVHMTEYPPGTLVEPHVHPENSSDDPGGSLRTVIKGSLTYAGRRYGPGDWFYIPNGVPYSFASDPHDKSLVMYTYRFFGVAEGNRFSHPIELATYRQSAIAVA